MGKQDLIKEIGNCVENYGGAIDLTCESDKGVVLRVDKQVASIISTDEDVDETYLDNLSIDDLETILEECKFQLDELEDITYKCKDENF